MTGIKPAGSASNPCKIDIFELFSDRRTKKTDSGEEIGFDLSPYIAAVDYYEDVFSPTITMKVMILNESQNVKDQTEEEDELVGIEPTEAKDTDFKALYDGLPIRVGERCKVKIGSNSETNVQLDFTEEERYLFVTNVTNIVRDAKRELFTLHLTSREAVINETSRVYKRFNPDQRIDASVKQILKDNLNVGEDYSRVDPTANSYGFIGNLRKPFATLVWLAKKSVTTTNGGKSAGFLFYQTKSGFNFRSVDSLMRQNRYKVKDQDGEEQVSTDKMQYTYSEATASFSPDDETGFNAINNDFKILRFSFTRNNDLIKDLRMGTFCSSGMYFNPFTFKFETNVYKRKDYVSKDEVARMGDETYVPLKLRKEGDATIEDTATRALTGVIDVGVYARKDTDLIKKSDPLAHQMQSISRYNTLFANLIDMVVPLNSNLEAGMVVECLFPKMSTTARTGRLEDLQRSGSYIIKELCHHYDIEKSYTSMKLMKDYAGENKDRVEETDDPVTFIDPSSLGL